MGGDDTMHGMTMRDMEAKLGDEVKQFTSGEESYCYLCDFTSEWVVYELSGDGLHGMFQRAYTVGSEGEVTFGEATEVERHTSYVAKQDEPPDEPVEEIPVADDPKPETLEEANAELERLRSEIAEKDSKLEETGTELETAKAELEKVKNEEGDPPADPEVRKELDEAREREQELVAKVEKMETERREERFEKEAKEYDGLEQPKVKSLLMAADEHFDEETQATLKSLLKGANEQVKQGALFDQFARSDIEKEGSWEQKLDQRARDMVAKGDADTVEQAKVEVMKADPELRAEREAALRS